VLRLVLPKGSLERATLDLFADADLGAIEQGIAEARSLASDRQISDDVGGWRYPGTDLGNFGQDFLYRAQVALAEPGDTVVIDIPRRELRLDVPDSELALRRDRVRSSLGSYRPADRQRPVSAALQVYAAMATSAATGAAAAT